MLILYILRKCDFLVGFGFGCPVNSGLDLVVLLTLVLNHYIQKATLVLVNVVYSSILRALNTTFLVLSVIFEVFHPLQKLIILLEM